jgi:hypothetical protein
MVSAAVVDGLERNQKGNTTQQIVILNTHITILYMRTKFPRGSRLGPPSQVSKGSSCFGPTSQVSNGFLCIGPSWAHIGAMFVGICLDPFCKLLCVPYWALYWFHYGCMLGPLVGPFLCSIRDQKFAFMLYISVGHSYHDGVYGFASTWLEGTFLPSLRRQSHGAVEVWMRQSGHS